MPTVDINYAGTVESTKIMVDGKEIKNIVNIDFFMTNPRGTSFEGPHASVAWATEEDTKEGIKKRTTFRVTSKDGQEDELVKEVAPIIDFNKQLNDTERGQYFITGEVPVRFHDAMDMQDDETAGDPIITNMPGDAIDQNSVIPV